jgi:hypothetical protein
MPRNPHWDQDTSQTGGISSLNSYITRNVSEMAPVPRFEPHAISGGWADNPENYSTDFRTRDLADRFDYGYGQMMNPQGGARQIGDESVNPDVFANVYGGNKHRRGAKLLAQQYNNPSITDNFAYVGPQQDLLDMIAFNNALQGGEIDVDPMYMDEDMSYNIVDPELFMTQEEQMADEPNAFIRTLMENYGRGNPFMQDLGGTYENYFGETFDMDEDQVGLRGDIDRGYQLAYADSPLTSLEKQIYPDEKYLPAPYTQDTEIAQPMPEDVINLLKKQGVSDDAIIQIYGKDAFDIWNESNFPIGHSPETAHLGNFDYYHYRRNGYTHEETMQILEEQGLA